MPGTYKRVSVAVGSVKFFPLEAKYTLSRSANQVGRRVGESLVGRAFIWADAHAIDNLSQAHQIELWKMATERSDPLHKVTITWFSEDGDKVLTSAEFMGWISVFQYNNPKISVIPGAPANLGSDSATATAQVGFNNLLYMELVVVLDETNVSKHKFTK